MTKFQQRVLTAMHVDSLVGTTHGPTHVPASRADYLAVTLDTSAAAVSRALRALEVAGYVHPVNLPGLTVPGWRITLR